MVALSELLRAGQPPVNPLAPKPPHYPAKARSVIFLFMSGAPSQFDLFEHKPALQRLDGQLIPDSCAACWSMNSKRMPA